MFKNSKNISKICYRSLYNIIHITMVAELKNPERDAAVLKSI